MPFLYAHKIKYLLLLLTPIYQSVAFAGSSLATSNFLCYKVCFPTFLSNVSFTLFIRFDELFWFTLCLGSVVLRERFLNSFSLPCREQMNGIQLTHTHNARKQGKALLLFLQKLWVTSWLVESERKRFQNPHIESYRSWVDFTFAHVWALLC